MMNRFLLDQEASGSAGQGLEPTNGKAKRSSLESRQRRRRGGVSTLERHALRRLLASFGDPPVTVVLWSGEEIAPRSGHAASRVIIHDRPTLWKLAVDPLGQFGEAYGSGHLEVDGDLQEFLTTAFRVMAGCREKGAFFAEALSGFCYRLRRHTRAKSRDDIHHHYDLGNDFYQLWLDEQMIYTCAYFAQPSFTLEEAQLAKMDHVCRKLDLRPGMTVMEAGCGWGALALHMARHYGVKVTAFNISHEQVMYARQQAKAQGMRDRVEFVEDDWRNIDAECDVFVSVGMLEHIGAANYRRLGDVIHKCLRPNGRALIHSIGQNESVPLNSWIRRRIFPGAYPPTLREMMRILEPHRFSVLDVENLRLHYARTLTHWLSRFEKSADTVRSMFDEQFVRMWRFYLASSAAAFETGGLQLFQLVFAPGATNNVPWTRTALYQRERTSEEGTVIDFDSHRHALSPARREHRGNGRGNM